MSKFKHLESPYSFKQYYSKYPEGYTIFEALLDWLDEVNKMVDVLNITLERYEDLEEFVNTQLVDVANDVLLEWLNDGTLGTLINQVLFESKADKVDFDNLEGVVDVLEQKVNDFVDSQPIIFDGTRSLQSVVDQAMVEHRSIFVKAGTYEIDENIVVTDNIASLFEIKGDGSAEGLSNSTLVFTGIGTMFTLSSPVQYCRFKDIQIRATDLYSEIQLDMTKDFMQSAANMIFENVALLGFNRLFIWAGGYYHKFSNCIFKNFDIGFENFSTFNTMFTMCKASYFNTFYNGGAGSGVVTITQSSFENIGSNVILGSSLTGYSVAISDSYFEQHTNPISTPNGLILPNGGFTGASIVRGQFGSVNFRNNYVGLDGFDRVFYFVGASKLFISMGNAFHFRTSQQDVPSTYVYSANSINRAMVNDSVVVGTPPSTLVFITSLPNMLSRGNSWLYNCFEDRVESIGVVTT